MERGCSVGANATILAGVRLGRCSMIAAGATVTRNVEPFALVAGCPARRIGTVCICGKKLSAGAGTLCSECLADAEPVISSYSGKE